jgi:hypothetical protein
MGTSPCKDSIDNLYEQVLFPGDVLTLGEGVTLSSHFLPSVTTPVAKRASFSESL